MKNISLLFLTAFAAWAVSVVSTDMATRKIPNASIRTGLKLLAGCLAVFGFYTWMGYTGRIQSFLNYNFYWMFGLHLFWTILAGMILWYAEVWPAGDAKFYILVSAALPLANPYLGSFPNYLFLSLLINIFVAASFWAIGSHIASGFTAASPADFFSEMWSDVKKRFSDLNVGKNALTVTSYILNLGFVFLLQQALSLELRGFAGRFFSRADLLFFFLFILWDKVGSVFSSRRWIYISSVCYLLYFFIGFFMFRERLWLLLFTAGSNVLKFSLLLFFGRFMLEFLMEKKDTIYLTAAELEPGVMLSSRTAREFKANPAFEGLFDDCFKDGLSGEQVTAVKDWLAKLPGTGMKVEAVRGRPFALWIFAGAALLLTLGRNIVGMFK